MQLYQQDPSAQFQSYLYGIEMSKRVKKDGSTACFNSTFMELKSVSPFYVDFTAEQFQSYLYGIEIDFVKDCTPSNLYVSIVPLWN